MKLVKECGIGGMVARSQTYSGAFCWNDTCCFLMNCERKLFCINNGDVETIPLSRSYHKMTASIMSQSLYAYIQDISRKEVEVYCLDECFLEDDCFRVRQEGIGTLSNLWFDWRRKALYLIYTKSLECFNLNGDCLGRFMKASPQTNYLAMCTSEDYVYLAYEHNGCISLAQYEMNGGYCQKLSLGNGFRVKNMEIDEITDSTILKIFAVKKEEIPVYFHVCIKNEKMPEHCLCEEIYPIEVDCCPPPVNHHQKKRQNSVCYHQSL